MMEGGFTLVRHSDQCKISRIKDGSYIRITKDGVLSFQEEQNEDNHDELLKEIRYSRKNPYSLEYSDIWKILQGYSLASMRDAVHCEQGHKPGRYLRDLHLNVWHGNKIRLQDKIPSSLIPGWNGGKGKKISFPDISDPATKIRFIYERTYWGRKLVEIASGTTSSSPWAKRLQKKISNLLRGLPHPSWSEKCRERIYRDNSIRNIRARSVRLLECLKTVQGIFLQRYLSFPNELWTWDKFDLFVLKYLGVLIDDEFYDGELHKEVLQIDTRYSELKKVRKTFKMYALSGREAYIRSKDFEMETPHWLRTFIPIYRTGLEVKGDIWSTAIRSSLTQTRGMGTPPPLVVYQSKAKFLTLISSVPRELKPEQVKLISTGMELAMMRVPDHAFTGLSTKARISITTSACWEKTRKEGGSLQAISELMAEARNGYPAKVISLYTGRLEKLITLANSEAGEYIFWRSLEEVLRMEPEEASQVYVTVVKEPAKARTVTKGMICLKIVLDTINKLVSYPLSKVDTSKSGMGKDAHGWNLFGEFFKNSSEAFHVRSVTDVGTPSSFIREVIYDDIFAECTDFVTATDAMHHTVCRIIANKWMTRCGIPPLLKQIVVKTCFSPRLVYFNGKGIFSHIGTKSDIDPVTRVIQLRRGMMMGDPLTKVVLHFTNISIRELARYIAAGQYKELVLDNPIRPTIVEIDTGLISVLSDKIIIEDPRPVMTEEGPRQVRAVPARVLPQPGFLNDKDREQILQLRERLSRPTRGPEIFFPLIGVHILLKEERPGYTPMLTAGYIPQRYRDPALLAVKYARGPTGHPILITGIRDPPDNLLKASGLPAINPYRSKRILNASDEAEVERDHLYFMEHNCLPRDLGVPSRVVSVDTRVESTGFSLFPEGCVLS